MKSNKNLVYANRTNSPKIDSKLPISIASIIYYYLEETKIWHALILQMAVFSKLQNRRTHALSYLGVAHRKEENRFESKKLSKLGNIRIAS